MACRSGFATTAWWRRHSCLQRRDSSRRLFTLPAILTLSPRHATSKLVRTASRSPPPGTPCVTPLCLTSPRSLVNGSLVACTKRGPVRVHCGSRYGAPRGSSTMTGRDLPQHRLGPMSVWPTIRKRQSHVGRPNQRRTYRSSSAGESRCLSAMTSTLQHPQIHTPRPHCVAILVCHHAG